MTQRLLTSLALLVLHAFARAEPPATPGVAANREITVNVHVVTDKGTPLGGIPLTLHTDEGTSGTFTTPNGSATLRGSVDVRYDDFATVTVTLSDMLETSTGDSSITSIWNRELFTKYLDVVSRWSFANEYLVRVTPEAGEYQLQIAARPTLCISARITDVASHHAAPRSTNVLLQATRWWSYRKDVPGDVSVEHAPAGTDFLMFIGVDDGRIIQRRVGPFDRDADLGEIELPALQRDAKLLLDFQNTGAPVASRTPRIAGAFLVSLDGTRMYSFALTSGGLTSHEEDGTISVAPASTTSRQCCSWPKPKTSR